MKKYGTHTIRTRHQFFNFSYPNAVQSKYNISAIMKLQTCNSLGVCVFCVVLIKFGALRYFGTGRNGSGMTKNAHPYISL